MMTVRAGIRVPLSMPIAYGWLSHVSCLALVAMMIFAPNFWACVYARPASACPEIPLDLRARPRLAARRIRLDDEGIEPFRGGVNGRSEPGGPGTDDDDVPHLRLVDGIIETEALRDLLIGRMAQDDVVAADQNGDIVASDIESIEELLNVDLIVEIDVRIGMTVARQELLDSQRCGAMGRAHEHDVAEPPCNQLDAAQYERSHEELAKLAVGLHERQHRLTVQFDDLARLPHA
jgi:hypothetical protein